MLRDGRDEPVAGELAPNAIGAGSAPSADVSGEGERGNLSRPRICLAAYSLGYVQRR